MKINIHLQQYINAANDLGIRYILHSSLFAEFIHNQKSWFIYGARTPLNPYTSCVVSDHKNIANKILSESGFNTPKFKKFRVFEKFVNSQFYEKQDIVIKPTIGMGGKGVSLKPKSEIQKQTAFKEAKKNSKNGSVLIEEFIEGTHFRVFILDNKVLAVAERRPAFIIGNGKNTIEQLINNYNDLIKGNKSKCRIPIDNEVHRFLFAQSLGLNSIPATSQKIFVRENTNLSTGGTTIDQTEELPEIAKYIAINAASRLKLVVAGVDLIIRDDWRTATTQDIYINEINHNPGLRIHYFPDEGPARDVALEIQKHIISENI